MQIECKKVGPVLNAYIDGQLSDEMCQTVEDHLKACPVCRQELKELEETTAFLKTAYSAEERFEPELNVARVWKNIESQIDFEPTAWERLKGLIEKPVFWVPTAVAAAAVVLVIFLMPMSKQHGPIGMSQVESVFSQSGHVMVMQTAKSGQPLIWILPGAGKETG